MLDRVENTVLVWTILGLALIGFIQVVSRYLFNYSFTWYEELGRFLAVFIAFLGAAIGVKTGSHFSMDLAVSHLARPWQEIVRGSVAFLSSLFFLVIAWYAWKTILRLHGFGNTSPAMGLPMYLAYLPIPIFSLVIATRYLLSGCSLITSLNQDIAEKEGPSRQ
jgi:C4-dicarboxylate transporter DctQ subunit